MAKNTIRGLTIVVDGDTKKLSQAFTEANKIIKDTKSETNALKQSLKTDWDNNTFIKAQLSATDAVKATEDKVKAVKRALSDLGDADTDEAKEKVKYLTVELIKSETAARQASKQLSEINQIKLDRITGTLDKLSSNLLKSGAVLTAGVTLPLAYVGKQALETASDLTEVQNVVDVSFKESAKSVDAWSKSLLDSNGISELTAKQNAGLYKSMANGMGIADEAGTEMSMTLTELISDVGSFKNLSFDAVGTKLKSIFTGETESLKDIGVVMTEANLNAFALAHGMEQLSNDMSQADKVALRYKFVVDALKDAQGDFARTIDSTANQQKLAQERFKSLSVELATELLPIATDVLKWANDLMKSFSGMSEETKKTTLTIIGLAACLGPAITLFGGLAKGASSTVKWVGSLKKANDAATVSQAALNATMNLNPYYFVAAALATIAVGLVTYTTLNSEAAKKQKELTDAFEESTQAYDSYATSIEQDVTAKNAELDVADKLIERYGILNEKVNKTATEKIVLQNTVKELSSLLGIEFTLLDTEAIKFDNTTASLKNLIQVRREEILQIANRNRAIKAQESMLDLEEQKKQAIENVENSRAEKEESGYIYDVRTALGIDDLKEAEEHLKKIIDREKEYQAILDSYTKLGSSVVAPPSTTNPQTLTGLSPEELAKKDKTMKAEKETLDARMNLGLYSEQVYYQKLTEIRANFYGDKKKDVTEMTEAEINLNREIYNQEVAFTRQRAANAKSFTAEQTKAFKDMYDKQKELAKNAYDDNKKLLKSSYDDTKKKLDDEYKDEIDRIDKTLKRKEESINDAIKAIDKEIEARRRLKQESEMTSKIDGIKGQLAFGKLDDFTRRELEAELKRLEDEKAEYSWELEQSDRKEALKEELTDAKERAERQKADLQELLEINKANLQEQYDLQLESLEVSYQLHTTQLENMFANSSTQMSQISSAFVGTISKGVDEAVKKLRGILSDVNQAAGEASSSRGYFSDDHSSRSASVNLYGSGLTQAQAQRMTQQAIKKELYE